MSNILRFSEIDLHDIALVGGKNASLGEMIKHLQKVDVNVPDGFAITTKAYIEFLKTNSLDKKIQTSLFGLDINDLSALKKSSQHIRELIEDASFSNELVNDVKKAYEQLCGDKNISVAVRSSATAEDLPGSSFAGQQDSYLNVQGIDSVLAAIKRVYSSLFSERAIVYRSHNNFDHQEVTISVGVQRMVRSDLSTSGVMFTLDTESGFEHVILITAAYGLGESIVQGAVNPDEFYVHKHLLREGKSAIIRKNLGSKECKKNYQQHDDFDQAVVTQEVAKSEQSRYCISDEVIYNLAKAALKIEQHYGRHMDIEWAVDGEDGKLYIVQARPETVKNNSNRNTLECYKLLGEGEVLTTGRSIGEKIGQGLARVILDPTGMQQMQSGEILVTDMTDPDWEPVMKRSAAIVTNRGGRTCHAAIIARELGIPAVVGCGDVVTKVQSGQAITVSCAAGETGYVYSGIIPHEVETIIIDSLSPLPFKLCMNLGNPEKAFAYQAIPNDGVGLARLEFIISNTIGIHPRALLEYAQLPNELRRIIDNKISAYNDPVEFYIEKLREGISTISAAFYPKPVIIRFSDFKSNEYANLIGGSLFEPAEENPMIGFRGAGRYLSKQFRDCFELECIAVKKVREEMGLTNTKIMVPFVRTLEEAKNVIMLLEHFGLKRGNGLEIYMMCEIPSNAILADEFLQYFDGFSIGSNDLTQLTLGLDRDSALVADLFDERDKAVKTLLHNVIDTCLKANKYIGICGQGPSDHLDFAKWLVNEGITSMSLSPDTIIRTWLSLSQPSV